ncbi:MAG: HEAT repeat domain-containing protein [Deltaproteobacteria bacterium]|jgi:HEAT repeat protein|nr:HEAT repeat domain-containing protein [Deltaproteobacteria bacterium]
MSSLFQNYNQKYTFQDIQTLLDSKYERKRIRGLQYAGRIEDSQREKVIEILGKYLEHKHPFYRYTTLVSLIELQAVDNLWQKIAPLLNDKSVKVREAVVIAMGKTEKDTKKELKQCLQSDSNEIRFQAPVSIVEKKYFDLGQDILDRLHLEKDHEILINLIRALGDLEYTKGITKLTEMAENESSKEIRIEAALSCGLLGSDEILQILADFSDDKEYGLEACNLLSRFKLDQLEETLKKKFSKPFLGSTKKLPIAALLARKNYQTAQNYLKAKTRSWNPETKLLAINRLGYSRGKWAPEILKKFLDKSSLERDTAAKALIKLDLPESKKTLQDFFSQHKNKKLDKELAAEIKNYLEKF